MQRTLGADLDRPAGRLVAEAVGARVTATDIAADMFGLIIDVVAGLADAQLLNKFASNDKEACERMEKWIFFVL